MIYNRIMTLCILANIFIYTIIIYIIDLIAFTIIYVYILLLKNFKQDGNVCTSLMITHEF